MSVVTRQYSGMEYSELLLLTLSDKQAKIVVKKASE
jgi:hypothetical protein